MSAATLLAGFESAITTIDHHVDQKLGARNDFIKSATNGAAREMGALVQSAELQAAVIAAASQLPARPGEKLAGPFTYEARRALELMRPLLTAVDKHAHRCGIYTFADGFVEEVEQPSGALEFKPLTGSGLAWRLGEHIPVMTEGKKGPNTTSWPKDVRDAIVKEAHLCPHLAIRRVSRTPIWRDGKLHSGNVRNGDTRIKAPQITLPSPCDKTAAMAAHRRLRDYWLGEVAFDTELDQATGIAALLCGAMRQSVRTPAIAITKPQHGAGASWLTSLINVVLAGETASMLSGAASSEEITKQVDSVQRLGGASIVFDNIPPTAGGFNNETIATTITDHTRGVRPFHRNDTMVQVECRQLVIFNGVNLRLADDLTRRTLAISIDTKTEHAQSRVFARPNLMNEAIERRTDILTDCYTIVAAYAASKERVYGKPLAGFSEWCFLVRDALMWLGLRDVVLSQEKISANDPTTTNLHTLVDAWITLFDDLPVTASQIVGQATPDILDETGSDEEKKRQAAARIELRDLIDQEIDVRGNGAAKALGNFLRRVKGRVIGDRQLETVGCAHGGAAKWRLTRIFKLPSAAVMREAAEEAAEESASAAEAATPVPNSYGEELAERTISVECNESDVERVSAAFFEHGLVATATPDPDGGFRVTAEAANRSAAESITAMLGAALGVAS